MAGLVDYVTDDGKRSSKPVNPTIAQILGSLRHVGRRISSQGGH